MQLHDATDQAKDLPNLQAIYPSRDHLPQFIAELQAMWAGDRLYTGDKSLPALSGRPLRLMLTMSLPALDDANGTALVCLVVRFANEVTNEIDAFVRQARRKPQP